MTERILLVDDEPHILQSLQRLLRHAMQTGTLPKLLIEAFTEPEVALRRATDVPFTLVISDYRMPRMTGVEFLKALRVLQPDCARVILSGYADLNAMVEAINVAGIARFFDKPWNDLELVAGLVEVLRSNAQDVQNRVLADQVRQQLGALSPQECERRRLERLEPGITEVPRSSDGAYLLEDPGEVKL